MLNMCLAHASKTMSLDQFDNSAKTCRHLRRESFELMLNTGIEHFLCRSGWLDRVRLGLVDHDHELYLSEYDHE